MRVAVISDVHSNLEALQAVEKSLEDLGVEEVHFAGDIVGYGPDPNTCARWIMENTEMAVMGNHDCAALGLMDIESFNLNAREAIKWNSEQMEDWATEFLQTLPMTQENNEVTLVHANPRDPESWNYIFTLWDAEMNFPHFNSTFCFVGHSHQPVAVGMDADGTVNVVPGDSFPIEAGSRYLVNVGSVGQPRDGNPAACFGLLDSDREEFSFVRVPYEYKVTQEKMIRAGLPRPLVERLAEGR
jgi:predicted phosphodiesterase